MFRHFSSAEHSILDFTHGFDQGNKLLLVGGEEVIKTDYGVAVTKLSLLAEVKRNWDKNHYLIPVVNVFIVDYPFPLRRMSIRFVTSAILILSSPLTSAFFVVIEVSSPPSK